MDWDRKPKYALGDRLKFMRLDEEGKELGWQEVVVCGVKLDQYSLPDIFWDYFLVMIDHTEEHLPNPYYLDDEMPESRLVALDE